MYVNIHTINVDIYIYIYMHMYIDMDTDTLCAHLQVERARERERERQTPKPSFGNACKARAHTIYGETHGAWKVGVRVRPSAQDLGLGQWELFGRLRLTNPKGPSTQTK